MSLAISSSLSLLLFSRKKMKTSRMTKPTRAPTTAPAIIPELVAEVQHNDDKRINDTPTTSSLLVKTLRLHVRDVSEAPTCYRIIHVCHWYVLHVILLSRCNLIGSLSREIWQYPMTEISNSGYCFSVRDGRLVTLIKTNKPLIRTNKSRQNGLSCCIFGV